MATIRPFAAVRPPKQYAEQVSSLPYDVMNRLNRRKLHSANTELTDSICLEDYYLDKVDNECFDLFYIATK